MMRNGVWHCPSCDGTNASFDGDVHLSCGKSIKTDCRFCAANFPCLEHDPCLAGQCKDCAETGVGTYCALQDARQREVLPRAAIDHPPHYTAGGIEVIDAIEAWDLGFRLGNAVKYIARAGKKDPAKTIEDLKKARWYLDREIAKLEAK